YDNGVTGEQYCVLACIDDFVAAANAFRKYPQVRKRLAQGPTCHPALFVYAIGVGVKPTIGRGEIGVLLHRPAELGLIFLRNRCEIDPQKLRPDLGKNDRGSDRAKDISNRISYRDSVDDPLKRRLVM